MKLIGYQVKNFRSVDNSGWINVDEVTALIGINESGKTNLLLPLWKLRPAKDGEIDLVADAPRKRYNEIKNMETKPVFITANFQLPDDLVDDLATLTRTDPEGLRIAQVSRQLDGLYIITFPEATPVRVLPRSELRTLLEEAQSDIPNLAVAVRAEDGIKEQMLSTITRAIAVVDDLPENIDQVGVQQVQTLINGVEIGDGSKRSTLVPRFGQLSDAVAELLKRISTPHPNSNNEACQLVLENIPSFVYYSNYGNLDSEIYLPHVIQNLERDDLGSKEEAKARTLKVLFDFVKLSPQEILDLGQDVPVQRPGHADPEPTEEEIEEVAAKKKEREILLQSAGNELTTKFRDWWKQGNYRIRFNADGNHFRIWVSDDVRTEEIELEGRSTGLQWFLSFYLIFLVESSDAHAGAILLLDEPGLSLHPLAQRDLSRFFENLAKTNQILYTTHSPFLVDSNHLDQVRSVYIDDNGYTVASPDLRASEGDSSQTKSIYAVHAAVGLTVSDIILQGCQPVIVEGPSDQFYLNGIKNHLIREGQISPKLELVFVPSGGVKGISAIVSILTGKNEDLPYVIVDSDRNGLDMANKLRQNLYKEAADRVLLAGDFSPIQNAEIEDLIPTALMGYVVDRQYRGKEDDFSDVVNTNEPVVGQIEAYAAENELSIIQGWKVEIARAVKQRMLRAKDVADDQDGKAKVETWIELFSNFVLTDKTSSEKSATNAKSKEV